MNTRQEQVILLNGPSAGKIFEIQGILSIGRSSENGLQINELPVSRRHAEIRQTPDLTMIQDLGSGNGTYVNNQRIIGCRLSPGDIIRICSIEMRFEGAPAQELLKEAPHAASAGQATLYRLSNDLSATDSLKISGIMVPSKLSNVRFESGHQGDIMSSRADNVYETFFQLPAKDAGLERLRDVQRQLAAIYQATQIISTERNLNLLFERIMDQIFSLVPAHNGVIILRNEETGEMVTEYLKSRSAKGNVVISSTIVNKALEGGAVISLNAATDSRFGAGDSIILQNISSVMCTPLVYQDEILGILYVDTRGTQNAFVQSDLELLVTLARAAAIAIKNAQYLRQVQQGYNDTLMVLANAIEARDHYTVGHTWRVTNIALQMAYELGWDEERLEKCRMGGVLHDVGKIAVDDAILRKPTSLTSDEYSKIKIHPERGARIMADIRFLKPIIPYCLYHHERYDGRGYPNGLANESIPLEGRLIAVADAFDAMTSNRSYRKGMDPEIAVAEIEKHSGTQFDPVCVGALVRCYRAGRLVKILQGAMEDNHSVVCPFCSTYVRIPDAAKEGDVFQCEVCRRRVLLQTKNEMLFGELVSEIG